MRILTEAGADVNAVGNDKAGLLHLAAWKHDTEILAQLLDAGVDINARDGKGQVPLHYAARPRRYRVEEKLRLLVDRGADVNAKDIDGDTPLHHLVGWGSDRDCGRDWDRQKGVQILIKAGADVTAFGNDQVGLLHLAAWKHGRGIMALLSDAGADINARDRHGQVPLDYAAKHISREKAEENIRFLVARGANLEAGDTKGNRKRKRD